MASATATGSVSFPADASFSGATLYVRLNNVSMMDAPATTAGEVVFHNVSSDDTINFSIKTDDYNEQARYAVSAHASMDGSDDISKGDYITKQTYSVFTDGPSGNVEITVESV